MDTTPLGRPAQTGEMNLEQIPKDILSGKSEHKSHWAIFLILIIVIIFGIFWFVEAPSQDLPAPIQPAVSQNQQSEVPKSPTYDLEASVGAIDIPSYSDEL